LSYADSFVVRIPKGLARIRVVMPTKKKVRSLSLRVARTLYLGFSVGRGGSILWRKQHRRFVYL